MHTTVLSGEYSCSTVNHTFILAYTVPLIGSVPTVQHRKDIFIMWTRNDIHIERIYPDEDVWTLCPTGRAYFRNAIVPEIIGKWFSRLERSFVEEPASDTAADVSQDSAADKGDSSTCTATLLLL